MKIISYNVILANLILLYFVHLYSTEIYKVSLLKFHYTHKFIVFFTFCHQVMVTFSYIKALIAVSLGILCYCFKYVFILIPVSLASPAYLLCQLL